MNAFKFVSVAFNRRIYKNLNIMSSSLSADRLKCEPESIKRSYDQNLCMNSVTQQKNFRFQN